MEIINYFFFVTMKMEETFHSGIYNKHLQHKVWLKQYYLMSILSYWNQIHQVMTKRFGVWKKSCLTGRAKASQTCLLASDEWIKFLKNVLDKLNIWYLQYQNLNFGLILAKRWTEFLYRYLGELYYWEIKFCWWGRVASGTSKTSNTGSPAFFHAGVKSVWMRFRS